MHDYKRNLFQQKVSLKDKLESSILLNLLPEKELNRPSYSIATISRIMSNYIRTLRQVVKREWKFETLNLYEAVYPLFVDFYECVIANELGVRRENINWDNFYGVLTVTEGQNLCFSIEKDKIKVEIHNPIDGPQLNVYMESNFMVMVRLLSYYFQSPENIPTELLLDLEENINLGSIFDQWISASDHPNLIPDMNINFDNKKYKIEVNIIQPVNEGIIPLIPLKERLKDGDFNYYENHPSKLGRVNN